MSKEKIFKELISEMAKDGEISPSEYTILIEKGKDLGLTKKMVDLLIKLELTDHSEKGFHSPDSSATVDDNTSTHTFRSAITRGGSILLPDRIIIDANSVTYQKRNKHFINVDTITVSINKISSVTIDTSIWGTDIYIKTFGAGEIIGKRFTKSDALKIKEIITQRQR